MRRLVVVLLVLAAVIAVGRGDVPCDVVQAQPACYVALLPGPTRDTLSIIAVDGTTSYPSDGELLLTTVAVETNLDLWEFLRYRFLDGTVDNVDRDLIFPPGQSSDDVATRNAALMDESQFDATLAGLRAAGIDVDVAFDGAEVAEVFGGSPADGLLEPDDVLTAVGGVSITNADELIELLSLVAPGEDVTLTLRRGGVERDVTITTGENPDDASRPFLGVLLTSHLALPFEIEIDAGNIGGPSAGLMFALGVVDVLGPEDLTNGAVIAGTGTIDVEGTVGPIGGIRQKVAAASSLETPAALFLVPRGNLAEARTATVGHPLLLVPVDTIQDALAALRTFAAGGQPDGAVALGR